MKATENERVEHQIQVYMQNKIARDQAIEKMEFAKGEILEFFRNNEESPLRIGFDELHDIKTTFSEGNQKKIDMEKLAEDLKVERKSVNRDFLIKSVDDGKLSFEEFTGYYFQEPTERISIRLVNAEGE